MIVICIAFAITTFLIVKVVPIFGEIFKDFGAKLRRRAFLIDIPWGLSGQLVHHLLLAIGGTAIFESAIFCESKRGKLISDKWKLKLPVFGPLVR